MRQISRKFQHIEKHLPMKNNISKGLKRWLVAGLLLVSWNAGALYAQTYCQAYHATGCYTGSTVQWYMSVGQVEILQDGKTVFKKNSDACTHTTNGINQIVMNAGKPFDLTAGSTYTGSFSIESGTGNWQGWIGVWVDLNRDGTFSSAEFVSVNWAVFASGAISSRTFSIGCTGVNPGASRMRVRSEYNGYANFTAGEGCNQKQYGETEDYEINLGLPTSLSADFILPDPSTAWVKTRLKFINRNQKGYIRHEWDGSDNGNGYDATSIDWMKAFNSAGTYSVKLRSTNCLGRDSMTRNITIRTPTVVPVSDFIANANLLEQYEELQLFDLSQYGPYDWRWEIYDSSQAPPVFYTEADRINPPTDPDGKKNPRFFMDMPGKYTVKMTAYNDNGWSPVMTKIGYVEVTPPTDYTIGFGQLSTQVSTGRVIDHAGAGANYGANRSNFVDRLLIQPCNAQVINLKFQQLRFADNNDLLKIYDGPDESGRKLHPGNGISLSNQNTARLDTFRATSGAMYLTFQSNASGFDSGFIGTFWSKLGSATPPVAGWKVDYEPGYNSTELEFKNATQGRYGLMSYEWDIDEGGFSTQYYTEDAKHTFYTDGKYTVCLTAAGCAGIDKFCKDLDIITPNTKTKLDFVANDRRPDIGEEITLKIDADNANQFEWSIFPTTYVVTSGSTATSGSKELKVKFIAGGSYTFTLKGWNTNDQAATQATVVKDKYVVVLNYCTPVVGLKSADVGINNVVLKKGTQTLMSNETESGVEGYTDYTLTKSATLTFGAEYNVEVSRNTTVNPMNRKVWIDFNIDGDFDDANEMVLNESSSNNASANATFNVPFLSASFEGKTRMRVASSYSNYANTPCGANAVGEFEDYTINLANDNLSPMITLNGSDTVRIERNCSATTYVDAGATAYDPTEGDITSRIVTTTDFDQCVPGIYTYNYNVSDASGNPAPGRRRVVIVVLDRTAPVLTLNGSSPMTVEQCGTYTEPGANAIDGVDGNLTTAIVTTGSVNTNVLGSYTITYTVRDAQGNTASLDRIVNVVDTKQPTMMMNAQAIVTGSTVNVQINDVFVDQVYTEDPCTGIIPTIYTPGFNGPVNTTRRATYPIIYNAKDPSNNLATNDGAVINYRVDDFVPPVVVLNTEDTIFLEVNTPYSSKPVTVSDNYYSNTQVSVVKTGNVDPYTLGLYTERYTATDASGNSTTRTRYVRVRDTKSPQIVAPTVNICIGYGFDPMDGLQITDNYYSPGTLLGLVQILNQNVNSWEAGVYYINYRVTDPSNNTSDVVSRPVFVGYPPLCQNSVSAWNLATSVNNFNLDEAISVYPNPSNGKVYIRYQLNNAKPVQMEVFNATGMRVAMVDGAAVSGTGMVDLSGMSEGIYLVRITNNGQTATRKVVVKH
jgi:hypothetical protein